MNQKQKANLLLQNQAKQVYNDRWRNAAFHALMRGTKKRQKRLSQESK